MDEPHAALYVLAVIEHDVPGQEKPACGGDNHITHGIFPLAARADNAYCRTGRPQIIPSSRLILADSLRQRMPRVYCRQG